MNLHIVDFPGQSRSSFNGLYIRHKCMITGTVDGITLENIGLDYGDIYDVEVYFDGHVRVPAFDQIYEIPYPTTYRKICNEVANYFKSKEIKQSLTPKTQQTFGDLINEL